MFHGHFGTAPWKVLVEDIVHSNPETAAEGSAPAAPPAPAQQTADTAPTAGPVGGGRENRGSWEGQEAAPGVNHQDKSSDQQSDNTNQGEDTMGDTSEKEDLEGDKRAKMEEEQLA